VDPDLGQLNGLGLFLALATIPVALFFAVWIILAFPENLIKNLFENLPQEVRLPVVKGIFIFMICAIGLGLFLSLSFFLGKLGLRLRRRRGEPKASEVLIGFLFSVCGLALPIWILTEGVLAGQLWNALLLIVSGLLFFGGILVIIKAVRSARCELSQQEQGKIIEKTKSNWQKPESKRGYNTGRLGDPKYR